jgi:predicted lipoprotein with Yx(FWY)xxD motif
VAALTCSLATAIADASGGKTKLQLRHTRLGMLLVNGRGYTLYSFGLDSRNRDACAHITACLMFWPPLTAPHGVAPGPGVKRSLIRTIKVKDGGKEVNQVTYNGRPLYTYSQDTHPGETTYVNINQFGGLWPAVNAAGQNVK